MPALLLAMFLAMLALPACSDRAQPHNWPLVPLAAADAIQPLGVAG